jgi:HK97 family phage prohead protease
MAPRETKRAELPLSRVSPAGIIEGYASLFGVADGGGDIVIAGAFARSLARRRASGVKMLWQHDAAEPIGIWTSIVEDAKGLKVAGQLDLSVARGREALSLLGSGAVDGLSIGFRTKRATTEKASGLRRLLEIDLWEISIVTFPMLADARVSAVKRDRAPRMRESCLLRRKAQEAALRFQLKLQSLRARATL